MPFKSDGSYYQVPGRAAVYATAGEVDNVRDLPRVPVIVDRAPAAAMARVGERVIKPDDRKFGIRQRALLSRRIVPNGRGYRYNIGYNKICGYYSAGFEAARFGGSSLNRKFNKEKNASEEENIHRKAGALGQVEGKANNWTVAERAEWERFILDQKIAAAGRAAAKDKGGASDGGGLSCLVCGCELSLCVCDFTAPGSGLHRISARSKGKIKDKATAFFRSCRGQATFVTLTFIQAVADTEAVKILNSFITQVRKVHKHLNYLWVAERQEKNKTFPGNIHFHIIVSRRLSVKKWNSLWVLCQYNAGLRAQDRFGDEITMGEIEMLYKEKGVGEVLNPFDIKKISTIDRLSWYLVKYITKNNDGEGYKRGFECAAWHCSRGVSRLFTRCFVGLSAFNAARTRANFSVNKQTGECFYPEVIKKEFWQMIYINNKRFPLEYLREMEQVNKWQCAGIDCFPSGWKDLRYETDADYTKFYLSEN